MKMRRTIRWILAAVLVGAFVVPAGAATYQANWYDNTSGAQCGPIIASGSSLIMTLNMTGACSPVTPASTFALCGYRAIVGSDLFLTILTDSNGNQKIDGLEGIKTGLIPSTPADFFANFELRQVSGVTCNGALEWSTGNKK